MGKENNVSVRLSVHKVASHTRQRVPAEAEGMEVALQLVVDEAKEGKHKLYFMDADYLKSFLEKVRRESGHVPVSIVLDIARYQHCKAVKDKVAEFGIDLIFLSPYSPNLNITERLWKYTRRHVPAGNYFVSPARFHEAFRNFFEIDYVNHKPVLNSLLHIPNSRYELIIPRLFF